MGVAHGSWEPLMQPSTSGPRAGQFSLASLFRLMFAAPFVLVLTPVLVAALPLALLAILVVAIPTVPLSVPILTFACLRHEGYCPFGVYVHLAGMLVVPLALPASLVLQAGNLVLAASALLLVGGALLAISECYVAGRSPNCCVVAWASAVNAIWLIAASDVCHILMGLQGA